MEIGFIGLGQMGKWEALNLLKAGFKVSVRDINQKAVKELTDAGAKMAESPKELAKICRTVITCVSTAEAMEEVVLGKDGVLASAKKGDILIDFGTTEPLLIKQISDVWTWIAPK